jgi:hypothetical integral membrane protein (TIGR02206 family)
MGRDHLTALAATLGLAGAAVVWARTRSPAATVLVRRVLAVSFLVLSAAEVAFAQVRGYLDLSVVLPLQLCDLSLLLACYALVTLDRRAIGILYFLALTGTVLALLTPELKYGFPSWDFAFYFLPHGLVVVAAAALVFGHRFLPAAGDWKKTILVVNAYAAVAGAVNLLSGTNFGYLCAKPTEPSPFDWFGPWPYYLLTLEAMAIALVWLLDQPLRPLRSRLAAGGVL